MYLPSFPHIDLFAAAVNALNGVLVARHPSHNRGYTVAGLLIMSFFGGIGGGMTRDILLNDIPSPLKDPTYFLVCLLMGLLPRSAPAVDRQSIRKSNCSLSVVGVRRK